MAQQRHERKRVTSVKTAWAWGVGGARVGVSSLFVLVAGLHDDGKGDAPNAWPHNGDGDSGITSLLMVFQLSKYMTGKADHVYVTR